MNPPSEIAHFIAIADAGSLVGAARALNVPRPTLSRQLARLEARLGVRLISRTTRRMSLTEAGAELYRRGRAIVAQIREAEEAVRFLDDTPRGLLRVSVMPNWSRVLAPFFDEYRRRYPRVDVQLFARSDIEDLIGGRSDAALRMMSPGTQAEVVVRRIRSSLGVVVASPAYLERAGTPRTIADLAQHECILRLDADGRPADRFPLAGCPRLKAAMCCDEQDLITDLAAAGIGLAVTSMDVCGAHVADGRLVLVLPEVAVPVPMYVAWRERTFTPPAVRALVGLAEEVLSGL